MKHAEAAALLILLAAAVAVQGQGAPPPRPGFVGRVGDAARAPIPRGEPLRVDPLFSGESVSANVVRVRRGGAVRTHVHDAHDETVYLIAGAGRFRLASDSTPVAAGAVLHIPRGTVHGFACDEASDATALSIFAPPFDGKDRRFVEEDGD